MELSIIIPTFNEGKYLPKLLTSIKKQNYKSYEVIISDAYSSDNTIKIAKKFGCKIIQGPKKGPGFGRNLGAKKAKGTYLLFFDSDVTIEKGFIQENLEEFKKRSLGAAGCYVKPIEQDIFYRFIFSLAKAPLFFLQFFRPMAAGYAIFSLKELDSKVKGFSNKPIFSEDSDYVRRIAKISKFRMLTSKPIIVSMRRFEKYGKFNTIFTYFKSEILGFIRPQKYDEYNFKFGEY
jgi:glycosyltransferase involved in cell wall biosynthesis